MKIKLHFNRVNLQRKDNRIWSAHTSKACNMSEDVILMFNGKEIGRTVFQPNKKDNPRAWVEFNGTIDHNNGKTVINLS